MAAKPVKKIQPIINARPLGDAAWVALMMKDVPAKFAAIINAGRKKRLDSGHPIMADYYLKDANAAFKKLNLFRSMSSAAQAAEYDKVFQASVDRHGNFNAAFEEVARLKGQGRIRRLSVDEFATPSSELVQSGEPVKKGVFIRKAPPVKALLPEVKNTGNTKPVTAMEFKGLAEKIKAQQELLSLPSFEP